MIDWLTLEIPYPHTPIQTGRFISITSDGEIDWETEKRLSVRGSYESNLLIRSAGSDGEGKAGFLHIDGNPSKFLNGHNVVGIRDIIVLVDMAVSKIFLFMGWLYVSNLKETILSGDFKVSRLDVNDYLEFNSESDCKAWEMAAEQVATSRQGKFVRKGTTLYMGKHSRRCSLKIYSKYRELTQAKKGHKLPVALPHKQQLLDFAENKLRVEAVFRSQYLKDLGLNKAKDLTPQVIGELYAKQLGKLEMNAQVKLNPLQELDLPRAVMLTYFYWKEGGRLRDNMPKSTFCRHRNILIAHGIDIKVSPKKFESNIIPLIRKIEAKSCNMPLWSESVGLIFN